MLNKEYIQTLHPLKEKTNKKILFHKYEFIKDQMLNILSHSEPTHTELMEALYNQLKTTFEGGIQWYGETVKLDLEARGVIERFDKNPERYRLKNN